MKTGLFFGSFNPIHIGHLAIANYMVEYGGVDQVWFIVSPQNPFKNDDELLDNQQRLSMVTLAVKDDDRFRACDIEFGLPTPSFTINTLNSLENLFPDNEFILIMGADNFVNFHKWKDFHKIARDYELLVYPRPGYDTKNVGFPCRYSLVNSPLMEISSTFIRNALNEKRNIMHFLPPGVWDYIQTNNLY